MSRPQLPSRKAGRCSAPAYLPAPLTGLVWAATASAFLRMRGVMNTSNSPSFELDVLRLKKLPMNGTLDRPGVRSWVFDSSVS